VCPKAGHIKGMEGELVFSKVLYIPNMWMEERVARGD
jgi:hypothetical protein